MCCRQSPQWSSAAPACSAAAAALVGTVVGAFILTLIGDVVFLLKLQSYWQPVMSGLILMAVVVLTGLTESRSPREAHQ